METEPSTTLRRATRVGGSFASSSARACGATNIKRPARQAITPNLFRLVNLENVVVFMTNPLFSEGTSDFHGPCWKGPSDGSLHLAPSSLNPRPGNKLPFRTGRGLLTLELLVGRVGRGDGYFGKFHGI